MEIVNVSGIFSDAFWYVAPVIVTVTTAVAGFLNQVFKVQNNTVKQVIAWAVASVLSVLSWLVGLISFGTPVWVGVVALCVATGLSSNGFYDISVIKKFVKSWFPDSATVKIEKN